MKTLCELGLIDNKPSNDKSSYFLFDIFNIADSQPLIPTTMATLLNVKGVSAEILWDEIDSFVTSDVENNGSDSSATLDLIDSAYKNILYTKKILIQDIINDVSEFIQNEIK